MPPLRLESPHPPPPSRQLSRPLRGSEARVPPRLASKGKMAGSSIVSAFPGVWLAWETAATLPPAGTWEEKSVLA